MNPADNLQSTSIEQQLEQALQELKVSHEERGHLLVALERASEEQDAMDEELEKKDLLIQEKEKELEDSEIPSNSNHFGHLLLKSTGVNILANKGILDSGTIT